MFFRMTMRITSFCRICMISLALPSEISQLPPIPSYMVRAQSAFSCSNSHRAISAGAPGVSGTARTDSQHCSKLMVRLAVYCQLNYDNLVDN